MATTPTLNGQVIGMTHYATRALLERVLESVALTFEQSVALNLVASSDAPVQRDHIVNRVTSGLKVSDAVAIAAVDALAASGIVSAGDEIALTERGAVVQRAIRGEIDAITTRLYGDLPAEDLATAGRVLTTVTERANAMLAG
jgi:hypothetical protein